MGSFAASANTSFLLGSNTPVPSGTANGVLYLNGSKVPTSGSALQFSGTALTVNLDGTSLVVGTGGASTTAASFRSTTRNQLRFPSGASFEWHEGVNELMRLNSTGLGIGTNNPQHKLDVSGAIRATGDGANVGLYIATSAIRQNINGGGFYLDANALGAPGGIYFRDGNGFLTRMLIDSAGNLGLGVTPSAWGGTRKAIQLGNPGQLASAGINLEIGSNWYNDGTNYRYTTTAPVSLVAASNGQHIWYNAPSGTAGNTITFTQAMTLDASGRLGIGVTNPSRTLHLFTGTAETQAIIESTSEQSVRFTRSGVGNYIFGRDSSNRVAVVDGFDFTGTYLLTVTSAANLGVGTVSFGTSAGKVLAIGTGTEPSTGPADTVQFYSVDRSAGNTIPAFYCEGSGVTNAGITNTTVTHKIAMKINGTVYYLLATTNAT